MAEAAETIERKPIRLAEAKQRFHAQREAQGTDNPVSDAARTLGKKSAEARETRQAEQTQAEEIEQQDDDNTESSTVAENASEESPSEDTEALEQDDTEEPEGQPEVIDLGDGVTMTLDEVRDGVMRQADYTRKTQDLSEAKKAFDSDRTQRLEVLNTLHGALVQEFGTPKSMKALIAEHGHEEGIEKYSEQQERMEKLAAAKQVMDREAAHDLAQRKDSTVKALSEKYGEKATGIFEGAVDYAAQTSGLDRGYIQGMISHPAAIEIVRKAQEYDNLKANSGKVKKLVANKPKVVKPGAKQSVQASAQSKVQHAEASLRRSHKLADAVAVLRARRGSK